MTVSRVLLALFFVLAGLNHFRDPNFYLAMIPPALPFPDALNLISGVCEIAGGLAVLHPRARLHRSRRLARAVSSFVCHCVCAVSRDANLLSMAARARG